MQTAIIEHYPPALRQIKEIGQIASAEDIEFAKLRGMMDETIANMFIFSANEEGVRRYENILCIASNNKQKLEDRKLYILSVLNKKKMSLSELEKLLSTYADVKLNISNDMERLEIKVGDSVSNVNLIYKILDDFMPLNISMEFATEIDALTCLREQHKTLEMETTTTIRRTLKNAWYLDGSVKLDGSRMLDVDLCPQPVRMNLETIIKTMEIKSDHVELISKKDLWYLDGSVKLDGSRLLDAEFREEEL